MPKDVQRRLRDNGPDQAAAEPPAVARASITQRHVARPTEVQRTADHAILDAAWAGTPVQMSEDAHSGLDDAGIQAAAAHGISGPGGALPYLDTIQRSFGGHDVSGINAHVGGAATEGSQAMGAHAYATGNDVAFAQAPDLFLVAHEAAHVVQQRAGVSLKGAVGQVGDSYEQNADAVAARVVAGESAEDLLGPVGGGGGGDVAQRSVQRDEAKGQQPHADAKVDPKPGAPLSLTSASRMAESSYTFLFNNQRSGLDRLGKALAKDSAPKKSFLGDVAGGVVGGAIGALLGPVGTAAAELVESKLAKKLIEKVADFVKDAAVETGKDAAKKHFEDAYATDPAANFVESQSLAINRAQHTATQTLLKHTDELATVEGGPASLAALASQIDVQAARANDLQIAEAAGAYTRLTAGNHESAAPWVNDDAGGDAEKGAIEIDVNYAPGAGIVITSSNWRGVGKETEGVVQEHGSAPIGSIGATLRVTVHGSTWGITHFEATPSGEVFVPQKSTYQQALIQSVGSLVDGHESMKELESGANSAARYLFDVINRMPTSSLKFGK